MPEQQISPSRGFPPFGLRFLAIIVLVMGVFFRFVNLDHKVYWFDETFTSLRISGYTESEVVSQLCNGQEIGIEDLQKYQRLAPEKSWTDTVKSLAIEDSQHPPLYYLMVRLWVQQFGSSVAAIRSLSALISLIAFPCLYWLCLELFESSLVGWVALTLLAVSPIHVLFAQEAREYSLWTVTILLSSASLLRAIRLNTTFSWGIYAINLALSFYTFLLSGLVAIGHFVYVLITEKNQLQKRFLNYLLASIAGFLIFMPWFLSVISNSSRFHETTDWISKTDVTRWLLIERWFLNFSRIFLDLRSDFGKPFTYISLIILLGYAVYFLCRRCPQRVWLFVLTLIGSTALTLMLPDIIGKGVRSIVPRYLFPCYLGFQLAVAYLLATEIPAVSLRKRRLWQSVMAVLLSSGIISCIISSQAEVWWNKGGSFKKPVMPEVARIINQSTHPLVISSCEGTWPINDKLSLSNLLASQVRLQLVIPPNRPQTSHSFSDVFFFNLSPETYRKELLDRLEKEQNYKIKTVYPDNFNLWRLAKQ
jgi:uncharacterized membrane protein